MRRMATPQRYSFCHAKSLKFDGKNISPPRVQLSPQNKTFRDTGLISGFHEATEDQTTLEHLKMVNNALQVRLGGMEHKLAELERTKEQLRISEESRNKLLVALSESSEKTQEASKKSAEIEAENTAALHKLSISNNDLQNSNSLLEKKILDLQNQIVTLKNEKSGSELLAEKYLTQAAELEHTKKAFEEYKNNHLELEKSYNLLLEDTRKKKKENAQQTTELTNINNELKTKLLELEKQNSELGLQLNNTTTEKTLAESNLFKHEKKSEENEIFKKLLEEKKGIISQLQEKVKETMEHMKLAEQEHQSHYKQLNEKYENTLVKITSLSEEREETNNKIKEYETKAFATEQQLIAQEADLAKIHDIEEQLHNQIQLSEQYKKEINKQNEELFNAGAEIEKTENRNFELQKEVNHHIHTLKEMEKSIDLMSKEIYELKLQAPNYTPVRGDLVDERLARYLNSFPEAQGLALMFSRESEGVYRFGTKRVVVKVEKENIIVRVGGGFLNIEEFIELYGPGEIAKMNKVSSPHRSRQSLVTLPAKFQFYFTKGKLGAY